MQIFGENACHLEPIRGVSSERSEGAGSPDTEILRCAQDDSGGAGSPDTEILRCAQDDS